MNEKKAKVEEKKSEVNETPITIDQIKTLAQERRFKVYVSALGPGFFLMCRNVDGEIRSATHQGMLKLMNDRGLSKFDIDTITLQYLTIEKCIIEPNPRDIMPFIRRLPGDTIDEIYKQIEEKSTSIKKEDGKDPLENKPTATSSIT